MISHSFKTKIYYKDIDQMGIVYYSRYFEFFESARTELLKSIGISVRDIEADNIFLPVVSAKCDYRKSAKFEDELIIQVKENIKDMLKDNFISDNLNYLMLAIDGVPSFAKMMEQKKSAQNSPFQGFIHWRVLLKA